MKTIRSLQWALVVVALTIGGSRASGDDSYFSMPLIQASFDQLIPTSYPTIKPNFNRLRPTTLPLIDPGRARVHITENLVDSLAQPPLLVNQVPEFVAATTLRRALLRTGSNTR